MPTQINAFTNIEFTVKFREPYVSEALNKRFAVSNPRGVYRGFRLVTEGVTNNVITVTADADKLDHYALAETDTGFSIAIRRTADFDIDLTALVDAGEKTWVIAIYADYVIGTATSVEIRAYELSPTDEFTIAAEVNALIVLGEVTIPAGGGVVIPAANVTPRGRRMSWDAQAPEAVPWSPVVRNGDFEWSQETASYQHASAFWERKVSVGTATWNTNTSDPHSGSRAIDFNFTSGPVTGEVFQYINIPAAEGLLVRFRGWKKSLEASTGGTAEFFMEFRNPTGSGSIVETFEIDTSGVDGAYVELDEILEVPAGAGILHKVGFSVTALNYGGGGVKLRMDDVFCWVETGSTMNTDLFELRSGSNQVSDLVFVDPTDLAFAGSKAAHFKYDAGTGTNGTLDVLNRNPTNTGPILAMQDATVVDTATLGKSIIGGSMIGTAANADLARVTAVAGTVAGIEYTLMWESVPVGSQGYRQYVSSAGAIVETVNAKYNNTSNLWTHDQTGADAMKTTKSITGTLIQRRTTTAATWNDSQWDANYVEHLQSTGVVQVNAVTTPGMDVNHTGTNDAISVDHSGTGAGEGVSIAMSGAAGTGSGLRVARTGTQAGVLAELVNTSNATNHCIRIDNSSTSTSSDSIEINHAGLGTAIDLNCTNTSLGLAGIDLDYDGTADGINVDVGGTSTVGQGLVVNDSTSVVRTNPMVHLTKTNAANFGPLFKTEGIGGSLYWIYASGAHEVVVDGGPSSAFTINAPDAAALANADALLTLASNTSDAVDYENIETISAGSDINSRHEANGDWHTDTGLYTTGAGDYAERLDTETAASNYEEGDLMVISSAGKVNKSTTANSTAVIGVYSTNPSVLGNNPISDLLMDQGTLEVSPWVWIKESPQNGRKWTHVEMDGDQTANYAPGVRCRMDAPYNNKGFKVVTSSYDGGSDKTTIRFDQTYPNLPSMSELYYAVPVRDSIPVGMLGLVPTKCITENGTIVPGDLLVSSSTAGHAMKAVSPAVGTVIGRAYETLTDTGAQSDVALIDCMVSI